MFLLLKHMLNQGFVEKEIFCFLLNYSFVPYIPVVMGTDHTCYYEPSILNPQLKTNICKILKKYGEVYIRLGDIILIQTYLFLDKELLMNYTNHALVLSEKTNMSEDQTMQGEP